MKQIVLFLGIIIAVPGFSTDRIVEEFGFPPAYSSISAAVAAANDGDRIIIKNRAGNIPWIEDITINKSLQFLSYANDDFFVVQGDYTIEFIPGLEVDIVGMRNTSGNLGQGSAASGTREAKVRLMDSWFQDGNVSLSSNFFDFDIIGNKIDDGLVRLSIGNLIGNDITGTNVGTSLVSVTNSTTNFLGDTCLIIGNRINYTSSLNSYYSLHVDNRQQVVHIKNNFVRYSSTGIRISGSISEPIPNVIWNNTTLGQSSFNTSTSYGIYVFQTISTSVWEVMSNVCVEGTLGMDNRRGIGWSSGSAQGGTANCYYNHIGTGLSPAISGGWTFEDLNEVNQTIELNGDDGSFTNSPNAIDGGNPAPLFYDIDLTTNDAGCWGGSYTQQNFFPQHTGAARVYNVVYPFNVRSGNTMDVKAFSFDR